MTRSRRRGLPAALGLAGLLAVALLVLLPLLALVVRAPWSDAGEVLVPVSERLWLMPRGRTTHPDSRGLIASQQMRGAIQGLAFTIATLGGLLGPVFAGWMYDVTESYRLAFTLLAGGSLLAVPLVLSVSPRRISDERVELRDALA